MVVVAATMAAPPTFGSQALEGFDGPIVIWDDRRARRFASDVDEVEATRTSGMLGSVMLANVLGREGRRYRTVSSVDGDGSEVARAVVGAAAARALRGARLGLLGGIIPGYGDVVLDAGQRGFAGHRAGDHRRCHDGRGARGQSAARGRPELDAAGLPPGFVATEGAAPLLARSLQVHRFLRALGQQQRLDGLALNCHSDSLRWSEELGVVACLASTLLWSAGLPVACTGDAATAVVLMLAARICGTAQYCEGYAVESETGELLVSSCGMADVSLRAAGTPARLCPNELYPGRNGLGVATRFDFAPGSATIAAFGPATADRPARIVVSAGELSGRGFEHMNGPSGTISFDRPGAGDAGRAWVDAGPAHHLALVRGDRRAEFAAAAGVLGVELIDVGAYRG